MNSALTNRKFWLTALSVLTVIFSAVSLWFLFQ